MCCSHPGGGAPCRRREDLGDFRKFEKMSENQDFENFKNVDFFSNIFLKNIFFDSVGHIKTWIPELVGVFLEC